VVWRAGSDDGNYACRKGRGALATFFPRSPVFVILREPWVPPKPGIPSPGFPRSPVLLFSVFAVVPEEGDE
jgi:hypothetical protein